MTVVHVSPKNFRIAILSSRLEDTLNWAVKNLKIVEIDRQRKILKDRDGREYFVINDFNDAWGIEFNEYVKAPDYYTLEDVVKSRVR